MYSPINLLSILLINIKLINSTYLIAESNYLKPKLERNNKINKGVWLKNRPKESFYEKPELGEFIFRTNSLDVDNVLQNNFDIFSENDNMQDTPFFTSYVERSKRSSNNKRKRNYRKSLINCKDKAECKIKRALHDKSSSLKSKFISNLRPASVFNDYPYEVAILLGDINDRTELANRTKVDPQIKIINSTDISNNITNVSTIEVMKKKFNSTPIRDDNLVKDTVNGLKASIQNISEPQSSTSSPKRSTNNNYESEIIKKNEFTEEINRTSDNSDTDKYNRDVFDKFAKAWPQNAIVPDMNVYNVVPKEKNPKKTKPVTEGGLVKVLSMLTKTFKKIIKHHQDIKQIHNKMHEMNEIFGKDIEMMTKKFQDFDLKYLYLVDYIEKLKDFEGKLNIRDEMLNNKEKELSEKLVDFENQQKKFLTQQHQFYDMQKLILAQTEKISLKQSSITKTQNEISHRQNNFARIIKKAKQLYLDNKHSNAAKNKYVTKPKDVTNQGNDENPITTSTTSPQTTETVKINLFSIPLLNRLENQDNLILKEKDYHSVDDLVYKYYFNNTFIDNLMKSNILASFITSPANTEISRNVKNVRTKNEDIKTTILLPVNQLDVRSKEDSRKSTLNRRRRWINHHSKRKMKRKTRGKTFVSTILSETDEKLVDSRKAFKNHLINKSVIKSATTVDIQKRDAFINMATYFCKEIGQNTNEQILNWCVEKALRRLKNIDLKVPPPSLQRVKLKTTENSRITNEVSTPSPIRVKSVPGASTDTTVISSTKSTPGASDADSKTSPSTARSPLVTLAAEQTPATIIYFPDNDELESNLKQFDMTPDVEGNYYYEGSLHASDVVTDSDGFSDIMPGLDSNSHVDVDPMTFDLQARRRAYVRRINANILKKIYNKR